MYVRGISLNAFYAIVDYVSQIFYSGNVTVSSDAHSSGPNSIVARLRVADCRGQGARTAVSGRHGPYACWHAYRDVLTELFSVLPNSTVRTALETYRGADGFHRTYPATAYHNIGSSLNPACMPDLCVHSCCGYGAFPEEPREYGGVAGDVAERTRLELARADLTGPEPLIFEGPESLNDVPNLAYSGR